MAGRRPAEPLKPFEIDYLIRLGGQIRKLRQEQHLGLEELADRAGLHRTHLWKIEKGQLNAGVISLTRLARVLNLTPAMLLPPFKGDDSPSGEEP